MKKRFYLSLIICFNVLQHFSQSVPTVIPPSPSIAALNRYSEVPVSYYNGIPNINIPIATLEGRELSVPINLSYHAGGHRVNEEATWVGLGWNLSAGGQITRTVRGLPDDYKYGFIHTPYIVDKVRETCITYGGELYGKNCTELTNTLLLNNKLEYQPDDFRFSAPGISGRFMFNQNRIKDSYGEIVQFESTNLVIQPTFAGNGELSSWSITDANGTVYKFNIGNRFISSQSAAINNGQESIPGESDGTYSENIISYTESWNLVSMISANGDAIRFDYDSYTPNYENQYNYEISRGESSLIINPPQSSDIPYLKEDDSRYADIVDDGSESSPGSVDQDNIFGATSEWHSRVKRSYTYLSKITSSKGYVNFVRDSERRLDLAANHGRLKRVEVYGGGIKLSEVSFLHDYFTSAIPEDLGRYALTTSNVPYYQTVLSKRLSLQGLRFTGLINGETSGRHFNYKFDYNPLNLPHKWSNAQDHWGYYNGANTNVTLIPFNTGQHPKANRAPNSAYTQACMLNSISYPEGGMTSFSFENNRRTLAEGKEDEDGQTTLHSFSVNTTGVARTSTHNKVLTQRYTERFTVPTDADTYNGKVRLRYSGATNRCSNAGIAQLYQAKDEVCDNMWFIITEVGIPGTVTATSPVKVPLGQEGYFLASPGSEVDIAVEISGDYDPTAYSTTAKVTWTKTTSTAVEGNDLLSGGLRVKSISNSEGLKRTFSYDGGFQLTSPFYFELRLNALIVASSQSSIPLLTTQAGYLGYAFVSEHIDTGSAESSYTINREYLLPEGVSIRTPDAPYVGNTTGGHLIRETTPVSETVNLYKPYATYFPRAFFPENPTLRSVVGMNIRQRIELDLALGPEQAFVEEFLEDHIIRKCAFEDLCDLSEHIYTLDPFIYFPAGGTEKKTNLGEQMETSTEHFFGNNSYPHYNVIRSVMINSERDTLETRYHYADKAVDFSGINTSAMNSLLERNRLNTLVETQQYENGKRLSTQRTNFGVFEAKHGRSNILPQVVSTAKDDDAQEPRVNYLSYTKYGQPVEVALADGSHTVYLWDHNFNYPIAKIENATLKEVNQALSSNNGNIHTVRQHNALPNAFISTYNYKPMVGITTMIDARGYRTLYTYDDFNRLESVKDANGKIMSFNQYHYKN